VGHVHVRVKFANPRDVERGKVGRSIEETALVDTGATFTTMPRALSEKLELPIVGKTKVRTATGIENLDQSYTYAEIDGKFAVTPVLISEKLDRTLVGVFTLEALGLTVDPTTGQLKEAEILLLSNLGLAK
jgi:predicted aspartyl protease